MVKSWFFVALACIALLVSPIAIARLLGRASGPVLTLSSMPQIRLSTLAEKETTTTERMYEGRFELTNSGSSNLTFSLKASCDCSRISPTSGVITPGESQWIVVGIKMEDYGARRAEVAIHTNDPYAPLTTRLITAVWNPPLWAAPASLDFGSVSLGQQVSRQIVVSRSDERSLGSDGSFLAFTSDRYLDVSQTYDLDDKECSFLVALSDSCPIGVYNGLVTLQSQGDGFKLEVPVTAYIESELLVVPPSVHIRRSEHSSAIRPITLIVRHRTGMLIEPLVSHTLPSDLRITEIKGAPLGQRCFEIAGVPPAGNAAGWEVELRFQSITSPATFQLIPP